MNQVKKSKRKSIAWIPTGKQQLFVEEYLQCWNATAAARAAGYADPPKSAYLAMLHPGIRKLIAQRMAEISMQTEEVILRLTQQARGSIGDFVVEQQYIDPVTQKPVQKLVIDMNKVKRLGHLIKKFSYDPQGQPRIEMYDAQNALALIGRIYGMFVDKLETATTEQIQVQVYIPDNSRPYTELQLQDGTQDGVIDVGTND